MVMKPEPWAQALTAVAAGRSGGRRGADDAGAPGAPARTAGKPVLIVPSPAGERFTQATAP